MLEAAQRMRTGGEFAATIRAGRRAGRSTLVVHLQLGEPAADAPANQSMAGIAVSKAVGGAVVRNRVARRIRPLLRERLPQLPSGSRIVVRALPSAATADSARLAADLDSALAVAGRPR